MVARRAWAVIAVADFGVMLYGFLALVAPETLAQGYESYTGRSWSGLTASDPRTTELLVLLFRLLGALNIATGLAALLIAVIPFRSGARWSWFALLAVNSIAYGGPITYDQVVGAIGVPEVLELVALAAILLALAISFDGIVRSGSQDRPAHEVAAAPSDVDDRELRRWSQWLAAVGAVLGLVGVFMALFAGTALFGPIHALIDPAFFGARPPDEATASFRAWVYGTWGATVAGWGITVALVAWFGIRAGRRWAWWTLAIGTASWFVLDTAISALHGVAANVLLNVVVAVCVGLPVLATRRLSTSSASFDRVSGRAEPDRT